MTRDGYVHVLEQWERDGSGWRCVRRWTPAEGGDIEHPLGPDVAVFPGAPRPHEGAQPGAEWLCEGCREHARIANEAPHPCERCRWITAEARVRELEAALRELLDADAIPEFAADAAQRRAVARDVARAALAPEPRGEKGEG